jgi:hypothetical protein
MPTAGSRVTSPAPDLHHRCGLHPCDGISSRADRRARHFIYAIDSSSRKGLAVVPPDDDPIVSRCFVYIEFAAPEYLADGRDRSTIRYFLPPKLGQPRAHDIRFRGEHPAAHILIIWSERRDQRMLAVLTALYLRDRELLEQLVAVAESRGRVDFYCRSAEHAKELQSALDGAAQAVLFSGAWRANAGQVVPCTSTGAVDWQALPEDHPLRSAAKGHGLGLIIAGGASRAVQS